MYYFYTSFMILILSYYDHYSYILMSLSHYTNASDFMYKKQMPRGQSDFYRIISTSFAWFSLIIYCQFSVNFAGFLSSICRRVMLADFIVYLPPICWHYWIYRICIKFDTVLSTKFVTRFYKSIFDKLSYLVNNPIYSCVPFYYYSLYAGTMTYLWNL